MSRLLQVLAARDSHIWTLRMTVLILAALVLMMYLAWNSARRNITVHIPPDLSQDLVQNADYIPEPNIYAFAAMVFQSLNLWAEDGRNDYRQQINANKCLITPQFARWLKKNLQEKRLRGELARSRVLFLLDGYSDEGVEPIGDGSWAVRLNLGLREWVQNLEVKETAIGYSLRIVRFDISRQCNPWGLALDAHLQPPVRIGSR